jgi:hypothetical protein
MQQSLGLIARLIKKQTRANRASIAWGSARTRSVDSHRLPYSCSALQFILGASVAIGEGTGEGSAGFR